MAVVHGDKPTQTRTASSAGIGRKSKKPLAIGAAFGAVALAAVAFVATRGASPNASAASTPSGASTASAAFAAQATQGATPANDAGAAAPSTIDLEIGYSPATATLLVDDAPVRGNPYKHEYARDTGMHKIRVEARGFETKSMQVSFENDVKLDLALDRAQLLYGGSRALAPPPPPPPPRAPEPPKTVATSDPTAPPQPTGRPKHTIDKTDPYAQ